MIGIVVLTSRLAAVLMTLLQVPLTMTSNLPASANVTLFSWWVLAFAPVMSLPSLRH